MQPCLQGAGDSFSWDTQAGGNITSRKPSSNNEPICCRVTHLTSPDSQRNLEVHRRKEACTGACWLCRGKARTQLPAGEVSQHWSPSAARNKVKGQKGKGRQPWLLSLLFSKPPPRSCPSFLLPPVHTLCLADNLPETGSQLV